MNHGKVLSWLKNLYLVSGCLLTSVLLAACSPSQVEHDAEATQVAADVLTTPTAEAPAPAHTPTSRAKPTPAAPPAPTPTLRSEQALDPVFDQVWELVRDRYVYPDYGGLDWEGVRDEYAQKAATATQPWDSYGLIQEMVDRLPDHYSVFYPADEVTALSSFGENLQEAGGIGVFYSMIAGDMIVCRVIPGSAAFEAGLRLGDRIVAVDGIPTSQFRSQTIRTAILGEAGTTVHLAVRSRDQTERTVAVVRKALDSRDSQVQFGIIEGSQIGLLTIGPFGSDEIPSIVQESLRSLVRDTALKGLIVDVRASPGGRFSPLLSTLGLFIDGRSIGTLVGRDGRVDLLVPEGMTMPELQGLSVVVLIGPCTQGAAELFAAGMQFRDQTELVGMPSGGYVLQGKIHVLPDGSELRLAEGFLERPDGTIMVDTGVQPDVVLGPEWPSLDGSEDPLILAAMELLASP